MKYVLVKDGLVVPEYNMELGPGESVPRLSANKGVWLPLIVEGAEAPCDSRYQERVKETTISGSTVVEKWSVRDLPLEEIRKQQLEKLAAKRYEVETGGVLVGEVRIKSDRDAQLGLLKVGLLHWMAAQRGEETPPISWKHGPGGQFEQQPAATLLDRGYQVGLHVQAAFENERMHVAGILACATAQEVADYDFSGGWPGQA